MLSKTICPLFNHGEICFHSGLNVILGDDDAKNSIGKSTALMVVDFAMGGMSLLEDKAGAIKSLGHHSYSIKFIFINQPYFFQRSTDGSDLVYICNENYEAQAEISIDEYKSKLKSLYALNNLESSFRSIVGPFSRIWNKGGYDPDQPFTANIKEAAGVGIGRLIDLFERNGDITDEKSVLDAQNERKRLITKSMNAEIIPKINVTQYKANGKTIADNTVMIEELKQGFTGALSAYEALFDDGLRSLHQKKNDLARMKDAPVQVYQSGPLIAVLETAGTSG